MNIYIMYRSSVMPQHGYNNSSSKKKNGGSTGKSKSKISTKLNTAKTNKTNKITNQRNCRTSHQNSR